MAQPFRLIDTGLRSGRRNIAFDQAMLDARAAGEIPDTLRFIGFEPCVLVGRHQAVSREIKRAYCEAHGIEIGRRITGGGAIYMDEGVLGWALVCHRRTLGGGALAHITRLVCEAAAAGLSKLGVDARFRPRNDIEVAGRKLSGTGGFFDGDVLIYQGTVLGALAPDIMVNALNVPQAKLEKRGLDDASKRIVTLAELTGAAPDWRAVKEALTKGFSQALALDFTIDAPSDAEESRAQRLFDEEIGADAFVYDIDDPALAGDVLVGAHASPGGAVSAYVRLEGAGRGRLRDVLFCGDFFVAPPRIVFDLEACLRGVAVEDAPAAVRAFFAGLDGSGLLSVGAEDFLAALVAATEQSR